MSIGVDILWLNAVESICLAIRGSPMIYQKAISQEHRGDYLPMYRWGRFTRYLEIGDDNFAVRQVDLYENGNALRYDRQHWVDQFGMLADMRFSEKWGEWWGTVKEIEAAEFESAWHTSTSSRLWAEQRAGAKMGQLGESPVWLVNG